MSQFLVQIEMKFFFINYSYNSIGLKILRSNFGHENIFVR